FGGNIVWAGTAGDMPASGYRAVDPRLVRDADGLYRITAGSPAVDAATGSYPQAALDLDLQPRTGAKDVGADEYVAGGTNRRPLHHLAEQRDADVACRPRLVAERAQRRARLHRRTDELPRERVIGPHHVQTGVQHPPQPRGELGPGGQHLTRRRPVLLLDPQVELLDEVVLGREVVVGVAHRQARGLRDRAHR